MALPDKCPLCAAGRDLQSVTTAHVYGDQGCKHSFFHCEVCDVRYQFPNLTTEEESRFYTAEFESFMSSRAGNKGGWQKAEDHIAANEETRLRRMKYLSPYLGSNKNLLEVGCSSGFMLYPLAAMGHSCAGIEPSGLFSEFVRHRNLGVYDSLTQMQEISPDACFDVILHFFVLEHVADPFAFLKMQLELLRPSGKIIFEIPNVADPLYSVYDIPEFERFYWSVAHPWYFSESSLHFLLKKLGHTYEIKLDQRYDLSNHMIWARDGRPGGMGRFTEILGKELEENYKQALIRIGKCDTLIGIISKE